MKLRRRRFGLTYFKVSELCLGTSSFSRYASQAESFEVLDVFLEAGGNFIQTTGLCPGASLGDALLGMPESVLERWLKDRRVARASVVLATRLALTRPVIGGRATYAALVRRCVHDSIRRIGCGYLDFLVVEWTDGIVPVAESISVLDALVVSGAVRQIVLANFPAERVGESLAAARRGHARIVGLQSDFPSAPWSACDAGLAALGEEHGLARIVRLAIGGGQLAGPKRALLSSALAQPHVISALVTVGAADQLRAMVSVARLRNETSEACDSSGFLSETSRDRSLELHSNPAGFQARRAFD